MENNAFLIFGDTNTRAAVTLAHVFTELSLPFFVIERSTKCIFPGTGFSASHHYTRLSDSFDLQEILGIIADIQSRGFDKITICPTSEFINLNLIQHHETLCRTNVMLPFAPDAYLHFTNKRTLADDFLTSEHCKVPAIYCDSQLATAPCVAKPGIQYRNGNLLYPVILQSDNDLLSFLQTEKHSGDYFIQDYVEGISEYFCFYRAADGRIESYLQENIAQQTGGKSMVACRPLKTRTQHAALEVELRKKLIEAAFRGPIMFEFIRRGDNFYIIEANPRFWGPIRFSLTLNPDLLALFIEDCLGVKLPMPKLHDDYYVWTYGALQQFASLKINDVDTIYSEQFFLENEQCDAYNFPETAHLVGKY